MRWAPAVVATFASRAGWRGNELATAVGVAMASSECDAGYRWVVEPGPVCDARGLWALDVVAHPELAGVDLYDPATNATCAHTLYVDAGRSWAWSPVWQTGEWRRWLTEAQEAASRPSREQRVPIFTGDPVAGSVMAQSIAKIEGMVRYVLDDPRFGR